MSGEGIEIAPASGDDLKAIAALLREAELPPDGVREALGNFFVAREEGRIVGAAGLELLGRAGLLRSVVVDPSHRGSGVATRLVARALERARARGVEDLYLLTTTADRFFTKRGFETIDREIAPEEVRGTREFREQCPSTAVLMRRRIVPG